MTTRNTPIDRRGIASLLHWMDTDESCSRILLQAMREQLADLDHNDAGEIDRFIAKTNLTSIIDQAVATRAKFDQLRAKLTDVLELEGL